MRKMIIDGEEWTTVDEIAYAIHETRRKTESEYRQFPMWGMGAIRMLDTLTSILFDEELKGNLTYEKKRKILEIPGTFVLARLVRTLSGRSVEFVCNLYQYSDENSGNAEVFKYEFCDELDRAWVFDYESEAKENLNRLGDGWCVVDIGHAALRRSKDVKTILCALFKDDEENEEESEDMEDIEK